MVFQICQYCYKVPQVPETRIAQHSSLSFLSNYSFLYYHLTGIKIESGQPEIAEIRAVVSCSLLQRLQMRDEASVNEYFGD